MAKQIMLATLVMAIVVIASIPFRAGSEAAAGVTAFYAVLVFYQLKEIRGQRDAQERMASRQIDEMRAQRESQERLVAQQIQEMHDQRALQERLDRAEFHFPGDYPAEWVLRNDRDVCIPIQNLGPAMARHSQVVLTKCMALDSGKWYGVEPLASEELFWADEERTGSVFKAPNGRYLVPRRRHFFTLASVSEKTGTLLVPTRSPEPLMLFGGHYCLEVTVYAENAAPKSAWFQFDIGPECEEFPAAIRLLREPPWPRVSGPDGAATEHYQKAMP